MAYTRFAIYHLPHGSELADAGASWLGWDAVHGVATRQPELEGLEAATGTPRKYGFHATLKPPFRLADGHTPRDLAKAVAELAGRTGPARADTLQIAPLGRFLALTICGDAKAINRVAAACVTGLDAFRAPATEQELARRRGAGLRSGQEDMLTRWGYPHVLNEFRFHMTLTARLPKAELAVWHDRLRAHLPPLPAPFEVGHISLVGERADGRFEQIERFQLTG